MTNELAAVTKKELADRTTECVCYTPYVDIFENETELTLVADMPGVSKDALNVSLENDLLTIEGKINTGKYEDMRPVYSEYNIGNFYRRFTVSDEIDKDRIQAKITDGRLTLSLPKTERAKPRQISIRT